jgi:hypothetical protein
MDAFQSLDVFNGDILDFPDLALQSTSSACSLETSTPVDEERYGAGTTGAFCIIS